MMMCESSPVQFDGRYLRIQGQPSPTPPPGTAPDPLVISPVAPDVSPRPLMGGCSIDSLVCWSTYPRCTCAPELSLQSVLKLAREGRPVGISRLDDVADAQEGGDEGRDLDQALARADPGVLVRREDAQLVIVLVAGFAVVSPILLVPPVAVRVAELSLDWGGLNVASVLCERACPSLASLTSPDVLLPDMPREFPSPQWGQLLIPLSLGRPVCNFVRGLNVPCLGPRHRSGRGRQDTSRRGSGCREAGRSVAGQLGACAPRQQPLPTAAGTPWLRFGGRASGRRSAGYSVVRSFGRSVGR